MNKKLKQTQRFLLVNIELILTGVGLLVIFLSGILASQTELEFWKVTAWVATGVGILHGLLFWLIRRRQRLVRAEAIGQVREMLEDLVKNKLQVIKMTLQLATLRQERAEGPSQDFRGAYETLQKISEIVDHLSEESLRSWRCRYRLTLDRVEQEEPHP